MISIQEFQKVELVIAKILDVKVETREIQNEIDTLRIQHRTLMEETNRKLQQHLKKQAKIPQIYK